MKWWIYLIIEMLVMIAVMLWIYFNPGDLEWNVVRSFLALQWFIYLKAYQEGVKKTDEEMAVKYGCIRCISVNRMGN